MAKYIELRTCPLSNDEFQPTRNNQIFSSKENRIIFHNQQNNQLRKRLSYVNKQLLLNFRILIDVLDGEMETVVHKQFLLGKGYSFSVFTHLSKSKFSTNYCYSVYEVKYERIDDDNYKITKII
jgi:hypothetical protein